MSLLLDALKKAEAAKRRKQEGATASPLPASTESGAETRAAPAPDLPAPVEAVTPDYPSLSLEDVVEETATASPEAPANPEPVLEPVPEPVPIATPAKPDLPELRFELLPQPPAEPVDVPPAAHPASHLLALDPEHAGNHDVTPDKPTAVEAASVAQPKAEPAAAPAAIPASPPPTEPARPSEPVLAAPAPLMPPTARSEAPPAQLSPEAARQLFDSKQKTQRSGPSPGQRLALIAGVGVLGLLAAGGWLWWQTREVGSFNPGAAVQPAPAELTDPAATPAAGEPSPPPGTDAAEAEAGATTQIPAPAAPSSGPQSVLPPSPLQPLPVASASIGQATPAQVAAQTSLPVSPKPGDRAQVVELPAGLAAPDVRFVRDNPPPSIARNVAQGFEAFQQGDYGRAAELYRAQLQQDSRNRDALLGLAAVAVKRNQLDEARNLYRRLLANDPKDALAATALLSLSTDADADGNEGRLKAAEASQPGPETATALAGLLARQGRWREAQEYYFKAHAAAPAEPDYAYNLAVALDALGEARLASQYYGTALKLRGSKPGSFNPDVVQQRLQTLGAN
ncbi:tetratricopeptide repeat protein [Chitinimonas viridis]|uniref:Tetratricopeptide repeat protein n=1 Tax=Chitinimonas viridis TaxID=664880 RepID=A0ABT8B8Z8_9NEIS|nr:tetratricopeptide repeat protein [Chitinimonas viridis]MDN3578023.1 tetratricopeptide repeat protein [Chitinimonas viridis]